MEGREEREGGREALLNYASFVLVFLWEQDGIDIMKLDWTKHRFGVTYLPVDQDCTTAQIDTLVRAHIHAPSVTAYPKSTCTCTCTWCRYSTCTCIFARQKTVASYRGTYFQE